MLLGVLLCTNVCALVMPLFQELFAKKSCLGALLGEGCKSAGRTTTMEGEGRREKFVGAEGIVSESCVLLNCFMFFWVSFFALFRLEVAAPYDAKFLFFLVFDDELLPEDINFLGIFVWDVQSDRRYSFSLWLTPTETLRLCSSAVRRII